MANYDDLTDDYDLSEGDVLQVTLRSVDGDELETQLEVSGQSSYAEYGVRQDGNAVGTLVIRNGTPMLFREGRDSDVAYIQRSGDTTHWVEEMEVA